MHKIKVLIVDDHEIFRIGLKTILSEIDNVRIVGEAHNGAEFLKLSEKQLPDIVLMDIKMPVMDGVTATNLARSRHPSVKIIVLSMFGEEEYIFKMVGLGVSGFLLKNSSKEEIEKALNTVHQGNQYFSNELLSVMVRTMKKDSMGQNGEKDPVFSAREHEVLNLLSKGLTNNEIADKLFVSPRTIEGYKSKLIQKTGMKSTLELVIWNLNRKS